MSREINRRRFVGTALAGLAVPAALRLEASQKARSEKRRTEVSIDKDMFFINGRPTYAGRYW